jgi:predicted ribonuclease YlaK
MNRAAILAIIAALTAIFEMLFYRQITYPRPIPALGFILGIMALFTYATDKSRHKEDN